MNLVRKKLVYFYFILSGLIILIGLGSLVAPSGLKLGIEFSSGSTLTLDFKENVTQDELRQELSALGYESVIRNLAGEDYIITLPVVTIEEKRQLEEALTQRLGELEELDFDTISPAISKDIGRQASIAIIVASVGILLYVAWAFRRLPSPFKWGSCAIVALVHDVLIMLGTFSILGRLFNIQIDALFVTAALAIVGYSVNNTVVVFDRLRENLLLEGSHNLAQTINRSIVQTLGRCLNTSLTTIFALLALLFFGGVTTHNFILALTIGVTVGTFSSIFIAPSLLLTWERGLK